MNDETEDRRPGEIRAYGAAAGLPDMADELVLELVTLEAAKDQINNARAAQLLAAFGVRKGDWWA